MVGPFGNDRQERGRVAYLEEQLSEMRAENAELREGLEIAEAAMSIVEPRSDKAKYLEALRDVRKTLSASSPSLLPALSWRPVTETDPPHAMPVIVYSPNEHPKVYLCSRPSPGHPAWPRYYVPFTEPRAAAAQSGSLLAYVEAGKLAVEETWLDMTWTKEGSNVRERWLRRNKATAARRKFCTAIIEKEGGR